MAQSQSLVGHARTQFVPSHPQCGPEEPTSVLGYCTNAFYGTNRLRYGSRSGTGLTGRDFRDPRVCLPITPQTEPVDQSVI